MPVCARCAESLKQPCRTWHPRFSVDELHMEHGILREYIQAPSFHTYNQCRTCWNELAPNSLGLSLIADRLGVERFHLSVQKYGPSSNCKCGITKQTTDLILIACSIHRTLHGVRGLTILNDETQCWLNNITLSIRSGQYSSLW